MSILYKKSVLTTAIIVALSPLSISMAEELQDDSSIERISVAGKRISFANNEASKAMIEKEAPISSVLDVIDELPGININQGDAFGGDDWSTSITMRGFAINSNEQQIGMTIDGLPNGGSNYGGGAKANRYISIENLSTVDVSQGTADISSASLDALGGTLNFISKAPETERETTIAYTAGDFQARRFFVRHETGEIFDDTYAYISYGDTSTKRWSGSGSNGGTKGQHFEAKVVSDWDKLSLTGRVSYDDVHEDNYASVTLEQFKQDPNWDRLTWNWTGKPYIDQNFAEGWSTLRENTFAYLKAEYDISDNVSLQVTPYYHKNKGRGDWIPPYLVVADKNKRAVLDSKGNIQRYGFTDKDGKPLKPAPGCTASYTFPGKSGPALHPACYPKDAVPVMSFRHTHYKKDRMGVTANTKWEIDNHSILAGLWYEDTKRGESRDWHKVIDARVYHHFDHEPYWVQYSNTFNTTTFKWYLQDTITLGDFTINAAVNQYLVDLDKVNNFTGKTEAKVDSNSDVLFAAGVVYQLNDEVELFGSFSQNFAAIKDNVLERDASALDDIQPETADNIDVGLRYRGDSLNLSATAYSIKFENRITFLPPDADTGGIDYIIGTNGSFINVGGVDSTGLELSVNYDINENFKLYGSYTYNNSEYTQNVPDPKIAIVKGAQVYDSVKNMWVLSANYYVDDLVIGLSNKYTGPRQAYKAKTEDYIITDLRVGYKFGLGDTGSKSLNLNFVVNNLFDKDYLATGQGNGKKYFIGAPKTAALTLDFTF